MSRYAQGTEVPIEKSMMEIRATVRDRYGATGFQIIEEGNAAGIGFVFRGRAVRIAMRMPDPGEERFKVTESGRERTSETAIRDAWLSECRRIWRVLAIAVKAKMELVENGQPFEAEFMPYLLASDGRTIAEHKLSDLIRVLDSNGQPALLPSFEVTE